MRRYAKGLASAATGAIGAAEGFQASFHAAAAAVGDDRRLHNVTAKQSLAVAEAMLDGEIKFRAGHAAVGALGSAAQSFSLPSSDLSPPVHRSHRLKSAPGLCHSLTSFISPLPNQHRQR